MTSSSPLFALLEDRLAQLRAHPRVHLITAHIAPPDPSALARAERTCGFALDPAMRAFYLACNGVCIRWAHPGHEEYGAYAGKTEEHEDLVQGLFPSYGVENLPSIYVLPVEAFVANETQDLSDLDEGDVPDSFCEVYGVARGEVLPSIRVFSHRCVEEAEGLFVTARPHCLAWSEEQTAIWEAYPGITFELYLRFVLGCFGAYRLRPWQEVWHGPHPSLRWRAWEPAVLPESWPYIASLDEITAELEYEA